jgi:hypothetical protein
MYVYKELKVLVISDDGWIWDLSWRKLGVLIVSCYPLSELASKQLLELSRHVPGLIKDQGLDSQTILISGHIGLFTDHWKEFLTNLEHPLSQCIILSLIRQSSISVTTELTRICQGRIHFQELRHSRLGGLTSARLILIWGGFGDYTSFKPWRPKMLRTNIMAGLDPIALLAKRATSVTIKQGFIWKPHTEGKLSPGCVLMDKCGWKIGPLLIKINFLHVN